MLPMNNKEDISFRDPKLSGEGGFRPFTVIKEPAHFAHLLLGQFRKWILAPRHARIALFQVAIFIVVNSCAQPQMIWSDAWFNVASVQDTQIIGNLTVMDNPTGNVGQYHVVLVCSHPAVPTTQVGSPQPAPIGDVDLSPEAFDEGGRKALRGEEVSPIIGPLEKVHKDSWVGSRRLSARGRFVERSLRCL